MRERRATPIGFAARDSSRRRVPREVAVTYVDRRGTTWYVVGVFQRTVVLPIHGGPHLQRRDARIVFASKAEVRYVIARAEVLLALVARPPRGLAALCARLLCRATAGDRR